MKDVIPKMEVAKSECFGINFMFVKLDDLWINNTKVFGIFANHALCMCKFIKMTMNDSLLCVQGSVSCVHFKSKI